MIPKKISKRNQSCYSIESSNFLRALCLLRKILKKLLIFGIFS